MSDDIVKALLESLTPEQKAKLIAGLTQTEPSAETEEEAFSSEPQTEVAEDFTVKRDKQTNRKSAVKFKKNQWVDDGELSDPDFEYEKFEKMKTPRKRSQPSKKKVECHVCGRSFAMNANLIYGEFVRCNKCTGR